MSQNQLELLAKALRRLGQDDLSKLTRLLPADTLSEPEKKKETKQPAAEGSSKAQKQDAPAPVESVQSAERAGDSDGGKAGGSNELPLRSPRKRKNERPADPDLDDGGRSDPGNRGSTSKKRKVEPAKSVQTAEDDVAEVVEEEEEEDAILCDRCLTRNLLCSPIKRNTHGRPKACTRCRRARTKCSFTNMSPEVVEQPPKKSPQPEEKDGSAGKSADAPSAPDTPTSNPLEVLTPLDTPKSNPRDILTPLDTSSLPDISIAESRSRIYEEAGRMFAEAMRKLAEADRLV